MVVVGHEVFAAQIFPVGEPVALDPRAGDHRYEPYALSAAFAQHCVGYVRSLGLRYGVIDFRLTPDGRKVFPGVPGRRHL